MKLGLIVFSVVIGLFLGTGYALATTGTQVAQAATIVVPQDKPFSVDLPPPEVIEVAPITIVGYVPTKHHSFPKHWICGEMHDNYVGGRNSNCEWK